MNAIRQVIKLAIDDQDLQYLRSIESDFDKVNAEYEAAHAEKMAIVEEEFGGDMIAFADAAFNEHSPRRELIALWEKVEKLRKEKSNLWSLRWDLRVEMGFGLFY